MRGLVGGRGTKTSRFKVGLGEHHEKLATRALVDRLTNKFPIAIEDKGFWDSLNVKLFVYFALEVEQHWRMIVGSSQEIGYLEGLLVGDGENDQSLRLKVVVDPVQIGHLQAD